MTLEQYCGKQSLLLLKINSV